MTHFTRVMVCVATVLGVWSARPFMAADTWIQINSPNFVVVTNGGEKKARSVAWQFEQVRSALQKGWSWANVSLDRPVLVIAAKDEDTMRALLPQYWERGANIKPAAYFANGPDRHYVVLRADVEEEAQGLQPYHLAYWEYSNLVLQRSFRGGLPLWIERGMASVISNTIVGDKDVQFGRPLPYFVERVRTGPLVPVSRIIAVSYEDWSRLSSDDREAYDAQSWALAQFLIFGDPKSRMNDVSRLVLNGASSEDAVAKSFGSVDALNEAYRLYVHQGAFKFGKLQVNATVLPEKYPLRAVPSPEAAGLQAAFLSITNRPVEARALLARAKSADATLALPYDVEALLAARENNRDGERAAFEKAMELHSNSYYTYYRLAILTGTGPGTDRAASAQYAEKAIALNDQYAPAYGLLGSALSSANDQRAVDVLTKAITLEPGELVYRMQLASALQRFGRYDEAIAVTRDALPAARTDQDRARLQQMLDSAVAMKARDAGRGTGPR